MPNPKEELIKSLQFLAGTLGIAAFLYFIVYHFTMPVMQVITAVLSSFLLNLFGIASQPIFANPPLVETAAITAQIVPLCVGDIELAILIGGILSTADRHISDRAKAAVLAVLFVFLINPLRIALTIGAGVWWGLDAMTFLHTSLFRITLLVVIVLFYVAWYIYPVKIKRGNERKKR